jgi:hypothetical protein
MLLVVVFGGPALQHLYNAKHIDIDCCFPPAPRCQVYVIRFCNSKLCGFSSVFLTVVSFPCGAAAWLQVNATRDISFLDWGSPL